jgi:hypothetical protein
MWDCDAACFVFGVAFEMAKMLADNLRNLRPYLSQSYFVIKQTPSKVP